MAGIKILTSENMLQWDYFVDSHPMGSIYHTSLWKELIVSSFGHKPLYLYVEDEKGNIKAGLPVFIITSRVMGNRLSSLPCAQFCDPLVSNQEQFDYIINFIIDNLKGRDNEYLELKTSKELLFNGYKTGHALNNYSTYKLDIDRTLESLEQSFDKKSVLWSIKKSYKSGIELVIGKSIDDLKNFYNLYLKMRKGYGLLPMPYKFFLNMWQLMSAKNNIDILLARYNEQIVSAILLLKYKDTVIYEYGASLAEMRHLCPNYFLLWEAIQRVKVQGYKIFDFGRTSDDNKGIVDFKRRWGTTKEVLNYYYIPDIKGFSSMRQKSLTGLLMYYTIKYLPEPLCQMMGRVLYKILL